MPLSHISIAGSLVIAAQQRAEVAERVAAQQLVLAQHPARVDRGAARGEPVVPDERHALDERRLGADHAVEPPEHVVAPDVARRERRGRRPAAPGRCSRRERGWRERVHRAVEPELGERARPARAAGRSRRARAAARPGRGGTARGRRAGGARDGAPGRERCRGMATGCTSAGVVDALTSGIRAPAANSPATARHCARAVLTSRIGAISRREGRCSDGS